MHSIYVNLIFVTRAFSPNPFPSLYGFLKVADYIDKFVSLCSDKKVMLCYVKCSNRIINVLQ